MKEKGYLYWKYGERDKIILALVEVIGILALACALIYTMNIYIAILTMFVCVGCYEGYRVLTIPKKERKNRKVMEFGFALIVVFIIFYFLDISVTYLAVHKLGIATELNQSTVSLWETHGYLKGELIHLAYVSFILITLPALSLIFFRGKKSQIFTISFLLILIFSFGVALVNNFTILITYYLGKLVFPLIR